MLVPSELDRLIVVLVRPRNPLNIGAAARAISNFGFHRLRVVNAFEVAFREARSAVGAAEVLSSAEEFTNVADAIADCALVVGTTAVRHRELRQPLHPLEEAGGLVRKGLQSGRIALLLGTEKFGLSNKDLSHCHWLLHIPTDEDHISMNLGQAVAVCLYEVARSVPSGEPPDDFKGATAGETERITATLLQALRASGYTKRGSEASTEARVRRLVRRLHLDSSDAELCLGMLRQILWKLKPEK